jgi:transporter family-2 protein
MNAFVIVVIGILGGLAGAVQSGSLGVMEERAGTLASTFVTYGLGGLVAGIAMVVFGGSRFTDIKDIPWWAFSAGIMGVVVVATLGITVSRLGLGAALTLFTASTLILGAVIDHFGWMSQERPFDTRKLVGVAIVIFGTWLVVAGDG